MNLHLAELTRVGEPNCIHGKMFSRVEGDPTKASDPASRLALLVDRLTSRYLEPCVIFSKNQCKRWQLTFSSTRFFLQEPVNFGRASLFLIF